MMVSLYLLPHVVIYLNVLNRVSHQQSDSGKVPVWASLLLRKYVFHIRPISLLHQQQQKPAFNSDLCDN